MANSYAFALRGGRGGPSGGPERAPVQDPPLHHVPALSLHAVFIDLRMVKSPVDITERNDFLLKDLKCAIHEVKDIWPEPDSQLLWVAFFTAEQYDRYLARLTAGVPWSACNGALVYGWAPGDTVTAVRLTGVPSPLPDDAIRAHFAQFGRVTRLFRSRDKVFTAACNGIAHLSIAITPGFTLPAFVSLVDSDGGVDKRMLVYSDAFRRRCSRCGTSGHVAQFCRAGHRAVGAEAALWSVLHIPAALLPPPPMEVPPPARPEAAEAARVLSADSPPSSSSGALPAQLAASVKAPGTAVAALLAAVPAPAVLVVPPLRPLTIAVTTAEDLESSPLLRLFLDPSSSEDSQASSLPLGQGRGPSPGTGGSSTPLPPSPLSGLSPADQQSPLLDLSLSALNDFSLEFGKVPEPKPAPASSPDAAASMPAPSHPVSRADRSRSPVGDFFMRNARDPRLKRSSSANTRYTDDDSEDDLSTPAAARSGRKRGLTGAKGGPTKATRKLSKEKGKTSPSQDIQECPSP